MTQFSKKTVTQTVVAAVAATGENIEVNTTLCFLNKQKTGYAFKFAVLRVNGDVVRNSINELDGAISDEVLAKVKAQCIAHGLAVKDVKRSSVGSSLLINSITLKLAN